MLQWATKTCWCAANAKKAAYWKFSIRAFKYWAYREKTHKKQTRKSKRSMHHYPILTRSKRSMHPYLDPTSLFSLTTRSFAMALHWGCSGSFREHVDLRTMVPIQRTIAKASRMPCDDPVASMTTSKACMRACMMCLLWCAIRRTFCDDPVASKINQLPADTPHSLLSVAANDVSKFFTT